MSEAGNLGTGPIGLPGCRMTCQSGEKQGNGCVVQVQGLFLLPSASLCNVFEK